MQYCKVKKKKKEVISYETSWLYIVRSLSLSGSVSSLVE